MKKTKMAYSTQISCPIAEQFLAAKITRMTARMSPVVRTLAAKCKYYNALLSLCLIQTIRSLCLTDVGQLGDGHRFRATSLSSVFLVAVK